MHTLRVHPGHGHACNTAAGSGALACRAASASIYKHLNCADDGACDLLVSAVRRRAEGEAAQGHVSPQALGRRHADHDLPTVARGVSHLLNQILLGAQNSPKVVGLHSSWQNYLLRLNLRHPDMYRPRETGARTAKHSFQPMCLQYAVGRKAKSRKMLAALKHWTGATLAMTFHFWREVGAVVLVILVGVHNACHAAPLAPPGSVTAASIPARDAGCNNKECEC
jgi:hypothetical protein